MRWSITGTTASAVALVLRATAASVPSGSNLRRRTSVEESTSPSVKCAKPQEWNIGAAIIVCSRALSGMRISSAAAGSSVSGWLREAPLGVPVVPEVRITTRPFSAGGTTSEGSPPSIRSSSIGSSTGSEPSRQAMKRLRRWRRLGDQLGELLVVDERHRLLALDHVGDLRAREGGVQVERVRARASSSATVASMK